MGLTRLQRPSETEPEKDVLMDDLWRRTRWIATRWIATRWIDKA